VDEESDEEDDEEKEVDEEEEEEEDEEESRWNLMVYSVRVGIRLFRLVLTARSRGVFPSFFVARGTERSGAI
jgi:hypothetical protein